MRTRHTLERGFTLVEAMIVCAIAAILASVAVPGLTDQLRKARRAEAFAMLAAAQLAQERWRSQSPRYAGDLASLGDGLALTSGGARYLLELDDADASGYTLTASARPGTTQAGDGGCARLRVRVRGGFVFHGAAAAHGTAFDESASNRCWGR